MAVEEDGLEIYVETTTDTPFLFGREPPVTFEGNLQVEVCRPGEMGAHRFLVGQRQDGWYVVSPTPFLLLDTDVEEWAYSWEGPFALKKEALAALPKVFREYLQICREELEELEKALDETPTRRWTREVPEHRVRPNLREAK